MHTESQLANLPPDGVYVLLKPKALFNGVQLTQGDPLPENDPVRTRPQQLKALVRQRVLALQATPSTEAAAVPSAPVPRPEIPPSEPERNALGLTRDELMRLTVKELQAMCKERGIDHVGNKSQLRKRLASALDG